jgi:hypothetical protein
MHFQILHFNQLWFHTVPKLSVCDDPPYCDSTKCWRCESLQYRHARHLPLEIRWPELDSAFCAHSRECGLWATRSFVSLSVWISCGTSSAMSASGLHRWYAEKRKQSLQVSSDSESEVPSRVFERNESSAAFDFDRYGACLWRTDPWPGTQSAGHLFLRQCEVLEKKSCSVVWIVLTIGCNSVAPSWSQTEFRWCPGRINSARPETRPWGSQWPLSFIPFSLPGFASQPSLGLDIPMIALIESPEFRCSSRSNAICTFLQIRD